VEKGKGYLRRGKLITTTLLKPLDAKTGLLTGLLVGKQDWKCPVALLGTCCGSKSLKVILIDSDFRAYPVLNPLVTLSLTPSVRKDFFEGKNFFSHEVISRVSWSPKMGDGGVFHTPCAHFSRHVEAYPECVFCGKMYRWGVSYVEWIPTFRNQQLATKGLSQRVCRITINITSPEENLFFGSTNRNTHQDAM
jgi:hypothetical protein